MGEGSEGLSPGVELPHVAYGRSPGLLADMGASAQFSPAPAPTSSERKHLPFPICHSC